MSCAEHYFENLLFDGQDAGEDLNKEFLSEAEQDAIETCYMYVIYNLFGNRESFENFINERKMI